MAGEEKAPAPIDKPIGASTGFGTEGEGKGGGDVPKPKAAGERPEGEARASPEDVLNGAKASADAASSAPPPAPKKRGRPPKNPGATGLPPGQKGPATPLTPEEQARLTGSPPPVPPPVIEWSPRLCGDVCGIPFKVYAWLAVPEPAKHVYKLDDDIKLEMGNMLKGILEKYGVAATYAHEIQLAVTVAMTFAACNMAEAAILAKLTKEAEEAKKREEESKRSSSSSA